MDASLSPIARDRMLIYGINPVLEALRAGRVTAIRVSPRADERVARARRGWRRSRACRCGACRRPSSIARRAAACIRAWSPTCGRGGALSVEDLVMQARGRAADRRARRHRGSAQRRRDPADGRRGRRRRRGAAVAARGAARRRGGEGVGRRGGAREDRRGREHRAGARGVEGRRRLDGRARGRRAEALRRDRLHAADGAGAWARKGPGCGGWCGSGATGWCRFRCAGTSRA